MIKFTKARWKNFLSTGSSFTEVQLDRTSNTLIVGENGAGKSTILDALCYGLYGKPFRKIKKDQLINSINGNGVIVEVEFEVYNHQYKVVRGIKPNVFEIYQNDTLIDQDAASRDYQEYLEKNILRLNMKSFTQIVLLGSSSFVPFMQLPTGIRREVIEDLLDIRIFSSMSSLLKERVSSNKEDMLSTQNELNTSAEILELHEQSKKRDGQKREEMVRLTNDRIKDLQLEIEQTTGDIQKCQEQIDELMLSVQDKDSNSEKLNDLLKLESNLESKQTKAKKVIKFYEENDNCPTCTQPISEEIKTAKVSERKTTLEQISDALSTLTEKISQRETRSQEIFTVTKKIQDIQLNISTVMQSSIREDQREISILQKQISDSEIYIDNETNTKISEIVERQAELLSAKKDLLNKKELFELATLILKDGGIKSKIIKQYIPIMNTLINKYLASMDFFVKFELNEAFEERILSRHRDDFTYESFSEGEKMRIDLALLFTWRTIARMKNSANTNLLILDEVFDASLDANGCEEFLKLIHALEDANVFVISHKGDILQDKFRSIIRFEKYKNFSRIAK
jgi:DNA repair exonuclease SbcCD ATPase subunit